MCICVWNSMQLWIWYWSFWQKWNFILGNKILCKHHPKWNAYTYPSKYWVVLKYSWNETSCEQNLFSCQFEISDWYYFIWPLMWTCEHTLREDLHIWNSTKKYYWWDFCSFLGINIPHLSKVTQHLKISKGLFHANFYGTWHEKVFRSQSFVWHLGSGA